MWRKALPTAPSLRVSWNCAQRTLICMRICLVFSCHHLLSVPRTSPSDHGGHYWTICIYWTACLELSVCPELSIWPEPTTEVITLFKILQVLGIAIWCVWAAHAILENPDIHKSHPPSIPSPVIPASAPPPLLPVSISTPPQPSICAVGSSWVSSLQSPSTSWLEDPISLPPASESLILPWPVDPAAPPRLLVPSSPPWPISPPAPPGAPSSLWFHLGQSLTIRRHGTPLLLLHLVPPALSGLSFLPNPPWSTVAPVPLQPSRFLPLLQSPKPSASPWPSRSSALPCLVGYPSPPRAPTPPPPPLPSVGNLELSALPPPWLLLPWALPWTAILAVVWVPPGSSCSKSLLSFPWLLPPSDPPWLLLSPSWLLPLSDLPWLSLFLPWLLPPSSHPWTLFVILLPGVCPPPEPPPVLSARFPASPSQSLPLFLRGVGGELSHYKELLVCFLPSHVFRGLGFPRVCLCHYVQVCLINHHYPV